MNAEDGKQLDSSSVDTDKNVIELADDGLGNFAPHIVNEKGELVPVQIVNLEDAGVKIKERKSPSNEARDFENVINDLKAQIKKLSERNLVLENERGTGI